VKNVVLRIFSIRGTKPQILAVPRGTSEQNILLPRPMNLGEISDPQK